VKFLRLVKMEEGTTAVAAVALNFVTLFKSLGGGWEQSPPNAPKPMVVQVQETAVADPAPR
jgi:hypothetical protein